ncbi:MAG TPA: tetratricopeptide repeat protein [Anaeromyxobacteraceae bacterium]|nr:tetratricopeptide repeat protein [Anaeromyxobacteraceae bacterium]
MHVDATMNLSPVATARRHLPAIAVLAVLAAGLYGSALGHRFLVTWDDPAYVTANRDIQAVTWENVKAIFTKTYVYNYAPAHILSYMADRAIWGLRPAGFVLGNIALHAASGILFYFLLVTLSWRRAAAFLAAAVFLSNPVQVESVAWISQRKTVLSGFFFLGALQAWVLYRRGGRGRWWWYAGSLATFALALLAKATTVIFPLAAIAFDLCTGRDWKDRRTWLDKVPFFVLGLAVAVVTVLAQSPDIGGGTTGYHGGSALATLLTMLPIFARYMAMALWPTGLSAMYAPPVRTHVDLAVAGSALLLAGVTALSFFLWKRRRTLLFWLLLFFIGLLPVSQVVPFVTIINDRYLYIPMIGAAAFLVGAAFWVLEGAAPVPRPLRFAVVAGLAAVIAHDVLSAARRVPVWKDDYALWEDAVRTVPGSFRAHFQLAHAREIQGDLKAAIQEYEAGLGLASVPSERYFLAGCLERTGALEASLEQYRLALEKLPTFGEARRAIGRVHNNLGVDAAVHDRMREAVPHFEAAAAFDPLNPRYHYNAGNAYLDMGLPERGIAELRRAVELAPGNPTFEQRLAEASRR